MMKWGRLLNRFRDEIGKAHLLKEDGSPACGASYYASTGPYPHAIDDNQKCLNCKGIDKVQANKRDEL